jgi:GT2 family glycosyltransferase
VKSIVDISAIVVTYNRDEPLRKTLECLLAQDPAPCEIIVVDQSLRHDEVTRHFLDRLMAEQQIRYIIQRQANAQLARNRAIQEAHGEVLLFVDDDVLMDEHLVDAHWKNYADREIAAVCGYYVEPEEDREFETPCDELPDYCKEPTMGWIYFPHCYTRRTECYSLPTCNGSVRREVAIRLGGFDENYTYTHLDDTDFSCRLKALGIRAVHDPEAGLVHLKELGGGKRPGGIDEFVIADSNRWYIWSYFFWMNFRWRGCREIGKRLRGCVFRRKNIIRPWYLAIAFWHFLNGARRAAVAIHGGRKLGFASVEIEPNASREDQRAKGEELPAAN